MEGGLRGQGMGGAIPVLEFTRQLTEEVISLTDSKSRVVEKPLPSDDPRHRQPDITLAKWDLGWEPAIPLREGLAKTIAYFDDLIKKGQA
jgi:UDP-glucuronate decarboxylase